MVVIGFSDEDQWSQEYEVATITRGDLARIGLSVAQIDMLTPHQMEAIARYMAGFYLEQGYWHDLKEAVALVVERRDQDEQTSSCSDSV